MYVCINELGLKFQEMHKHFELPRIGEATKWGVPGIGNILKYKLDLPWNQSDQSLVAALNTRWTAQALLRDAQNAKGETEDLQKDLDLAKEAVKTWGFSVKAAGHECDIQNTLPQIEKIRECTTDFAKEGQTAKKQPWFKPKFYKRTAASWYQNSPTFRRSLEDILALNAAKASQAVKALCFTSEGDTKTSKCLTKDEDKEASELSANAVKGDLAWLIKQTWIHQDTEETLDKFGSAIFKKQRDVKNAIRRATAESKRAKAVVKAFGFSLTNTIKMCNELYESESTMHGAEILEQIKQETNDPVKKDALAMINSPGGKCVQKTEDSYCPEGMSGRLRRKDIDYKAAVATYFLSAATWGNPLAMAVLGTVGFITGGPIGAGAGVAAAVAIPFEWFLPIPVALYVAVDIFPKCRCNINPCVLDTDTDTCAMKPSGNSKNPYEWLPYPGMKCAPAKADPTKCITQACDAEDYQWQNYKGPMPDVLGLVGVHQKASQKAGAYNCLNVAGTPLALMHKVQLEKWMSESIQPKRAVPKQGFTAAIVSQRNALFDTLKPPTASQPNQLEDSDPKHLELVKEAEEVGDHLQPPQLVNLISPPEEDDEIVVDDKLSSSNSAPPVTVVGEVNNHDVDLNKTAWMNNDVWSRSG